MKPSTTILNAIKVFEEFRKLDPEMQMQTALIFLLIANHEGCSISDLEKWTGLTSASCSRNVAALSDIHRKGRPGHNLVVARVAAEDRRQRNLYLTVKGRSVLNNVMERFAPPLELA
jgi:DNA-binding MarR family transcriptional regulator